MIIYKSNRKFNLTDYFDSHGQMLLRSYKDEEYDYNIDIIFFGVSYINMPISFKNLVITVIEPNDVLNELVYSQKIKQNDRIFEILSDKMKFYIYASFFKVYKNYLDFNETSLGIIDCKGRDKLVYKSTNTV